MKFKYYWLCLCFLLVMLLQPVVVSATSTKSLCTTPLSDQAVAEVFRQNALKQLALEFGDSGLFVYEIEQTPVDEVVVRIESFAKYPKPGVKDLATMRLKGWVSRCHGTTIIRGNTWLADGTLSVNRYAAKDLKGKGLQWGNPDAPQRFIVYLDSRCPHCHRLIAYAKKLVEDGKVFLDIRQVAYLESVEEAISDTRLSETVLSLADNVTVSDQEYLEMLSGFANENLVKGKGKGFVNAKKLIQANTATAQKILHIITVPGVLIQEKEHHNQYRQIGYWETNRIFQ